MHCFPLSMIHCQQEWPCSVIHANHKQGLGKPCTKTISIKDALCLNPHLFLVRNLQHHVLLKRKMDRTRDAGHHQKSSPEPSDDRHRTSALGGISRNPFSDACGRVLAPPAIQKKRPNGMVRSQQDRHQYISDQTQAHRLGQRPRTVQIRLAHLG